MDRISDPLWNRLDDFVRAMIAAFFIAIFAVGGVYLTPDLKTPSEWVSWTQLLIAVGIFSKRTMPLSAAGIIALWLLALRDYDLFHLLDYLALGIGAAAYLVLAHRTRGLARPPLRGLALGRGHSAHVVQLREIRLSQLVLSLVEERPFLTFGIPRDVFIPMAGVAEFAWALAFSPPR